MELNQRLELIKKGLSINDTVIFEIIYSRQKEIRNLHDAYIQAEIKQSELSVMLNISETSVSRSIKNLIKYNLIIKKSRGVYLIKTAINPPIMVITK